MGYQKSPIYVRGLLGLATHPDLLSTDDEASPEDVLALRSCADILRGMAEREARKQIEANHR